MAEPDDLDRVLKLFQCHSHDAELHLRHLSALDKLCKAGSGFAVRDLPRITQILGYTLDLVLSQHASVFLEPACRLVGAVGRPCVKQSSSDELRLLGVVSNLLGAVVRVFTEQMPWQLQACTAEVLQEFASVWGNRPVAPSSQSVSVAEMDLQSVQRVYHTHSTLLYQSQVVPAVCQALQRALDSRAAPSSSTPSTQQAAHSDAGDTHQQSQQQWSPAEAGDAGGLVPALVESLLEFSYSPQLCQQLLQAGVLSVLAQLLLPEAAAGMGSRLSTQVIEMLWNLFDLAAETANQVAAGSSGHPAQHQAHMQEQQDQQDQQAQASSGAGALQDEPSQEQALQPLQQDALSAASPVAQQLVDVLAVALQQQVATCSSLQRQQQRNDTLTVLSLLAQCSSFLPAIISCAPLMQQLLAAACNPTAARDAPTTSTPLSHSVTVTAAPSSGATPSASNSSTLEADHNMQLLAWAILGSAAAKAEPAREAFIQAGLLQLLLDTAAFGCCGGTMVGSERALCHAWLGRLSPEQLAASKQLAWSTLQQVAPVCKDSFIKCGGVTMLLDSLTAVSSIGTTSTSFASSSMGTKSPSRSAAGQALASLHSSSPVGGRASAAAAGSASSCGAAEPALRLLRRLLQEDAAMAAAVVDRGGVQVLLQLLQAPAAATLTSVRQGVLLCLSELCSAGGRAGTTAVRAADGVPLLLKECQSILDGDPYVASLAALDALWRCCIPSNRSRAQLLAADGMDTILGLLQRGNPALRPVLLSLLADLLSDKRSHSFFWEWHARAAAGGSGWGSSSSSFSIPRARPPSGSGAGATPAGALHAVQSDLTAGVAKGSFLLSSGKEQAGAWLLACCGKGSGSALGTSSSVTAAQVLISVWRHQDKALGISGPEGVLANPSRPLAGSGGGDGSSGRSVQGAARGSSAGGGVSSSHVDAYGLMLPGRRLVVERMAQANSPQSIMEKVYACFAALGVAGSKDSSSVSQDGLAALQQLPAADLATLAVIQQYTAFRQGEVWQDIRAGFSAEGLQLTQEDSMRLESGIRRAEMVAAEVQAAQVAMLGAASAQQLAIERIVYDNMAAQAAADARAKVYEKDCSKLTMRERLAAKARKEDMLSRAVVVSSGLPAVEQQTEQG